MVVFVYICFVGVVGTGESLKMSSKVPRASEKRRYRRPGPQAGARSSENHPGIVSRCGLLTALSICALCTQSLEPRNLSLTAADIVVAADLVGLAANQGESDRCLGVRAHDECRSRFCCERESMWQRERERERERECVCVCVCVLRLYACVYS